MKQEKPPSRQGKKSTAIYFEKNSDTHERLKLFAVRSGQSMNQIILEAIETHLKKNGA